MKSVRKRIVVLFSAILLTIPTTPALAVLESSSTVPIFTDVPSGSWCAESVAWAIEQGITNGTSATTFSPNDTCSNAQVLTFLWRACGSPDSSGNNPYKDIANGSFYYKAALWAYENGMVGGDRFQPDKPCTRSMAVDYMWKQAGCPKASSDLDFADVSANADYAQAVAWALDMQITNGTSDTTFSPEGTCTRAQILTFLYRGLAENIPVESDSDYLDIICSEGV